MIRQTLNVSCSTDRTHSSNLQTPKHHGVGINGNEKEISNLKELCSQPNGRSSQSRSLSPFRGIGRIRKTVRHFFLVLLPKN
jgi:hypothetical protein